MLLRVMAFIELLLYLWTCPNLITLFNLQKKKKFCSMLVLVTFQKEEK